MNRILITLLLLIFSLAAAWGQGYWEEALGPYGGAFNQVVRTPSGILYMTKKLYKVYRSDDDGNSWYPVKNPQLDPLIPSSWEVEISLAGNFYKTITYPNGVTRIYRSSDEGETWPLIVESDSILKLTETANGVWIAAYPTGIHRSTDQGQTWQQVFSAPVVTTGSTNISPSGEIWVITDYAGSFARSTDQGSTWQLITTSTSSTTRYHFVTSTGVIFLRGAGQLYRSDNNGQTFEQITIDTSQYIQVTGNMVELPNGRLLASTLGKVFYSDNMGISWFLLSSPFAVYYFFDRATLPNGKIFCRGWDFPSLFQSSDGALTWHFSETGVKHGGRNPLYFKSPDTLYCASEFLWRSIDAGENWTAMTDISKGFVFEMESVGKGDSIFFRQGDKMFFSPNGGATLYDRTPPGGLDFYDFFVGNLHFNNNTSTLFVNSNKSLFRSVDMGQNWEILMDSTNTKRILFNPGGKIFLFAIGFNDSLGLYSDSELWVSDDNGSSWETIPDFSNNIIRSICQNKEGEVFVAAENGLYISTNNGLTWQRRGERPPLNIYGPMKNDFFSAVNGFLFYLGDWDLYMSTDKGISWQTVPSVLGKAYLSSTGQYVQNVFFYLSPDQYLYASSEGTLLKSAKPVFSGSFINGNVLRDADNECSTPDAQMPLKSWVVEAEGGSDYFTVTDTLGKYRLFVDTGAYQVFVRTPNLLWWEICDSAQTIIIDSLYTSGTLDFASHALADCPLMTTSVAAPFLRRCFDNTIFVQYCNQGSETADSAWVDIYLDPYMSFTSSVQPYNSLGNNVFRFLLGDVESGECGQFSLVAYMDCDSTVLGQTHCITAHGYPDTLCTTVPNWSGATIEAEIECQDTSVQFRLHNTGGAGSQMLDYIIIEDDVVLMQGQESYAPGEEKTIQRPANGHTWRIESLQEPGHPFSNVAVAFAEGCGGFESLGFINQFNVNTFQPSWNRLCLENIGAYDPNDKQGFPLGFGSEHQIRPGQELKYMIRFQNTGTDTAFTVVIRDTLSAWLDPATLRPGAASHLYTWELSGQGVLSFSFSNILLPDSNTNLAASQGFVTFKINQQPDVPLQTQIFNSAAIYFDFNQPVITNQTLHTVGVDYLVGTHAPKDFGKQNQVIVSPNPVAESAVFQLNEGLFNQHRIIVTDAFGRKIREEKISGKQHLFLRRGLPPGTYFFRVEDAGGRLMDSGKIILK